MGLAQLLEGSPGLLGVRNQAIADEHHAELEAGRGRIRLELDRARLAFYELSAEERSARFDAHRERRAKSSSAKAKEELSEAERDKREAAAERARAEDRPIFLSIGYSACHWCHVMERESFEDEGIAQLMNRWFVNVKVDREERPDLDEIYMKAVQALTGQGGWPMSVFLTPDLEPFFGGTYFPPHGAYGRPGFADVLNSLGQTWQNERTKVVERAGRLTEMIRKEATP